MNDDGIFDMDSPAATAAHDQTVSEALAAIRKAEHFVVSTVDADGRCAIAVSAPFSFVVYTERALGEQSTRLLAAEIEGMSMDDLRNILGNQETP